MLRLTDSCQSAFVRLPAGGVENVAPGTDFELQRVSEVGAGAPVSSVAARGSSSASSRSGVFSTGRGLGDDGGGVWLAIRRLALAPGRDPLAPAGPASSRAVSSVRTGLWLRRDVDDGTDGESDASWTRASVPRGCAGAGERCHNLVDPSTRRRESGPESLWVMTRRRRAFPLGPVPANDLGALVACPGIPVHTLSSATQSIGSHVRAVGKAASLRDQLAPSLVAARLSEPGERQPAVRQRADDHHDSARHGNQPGVTSQSQAVAMALREGMI
jgi:hypothetical protein